MINFRAIFIEFLNFLMTEFAMPDKFLTDSKILSIKKEIRAMRAEDISTESTMMSSSNNRYKLSVTMLTF